MRNALDSKIVDAWYPRCLDEHRGGFHQEYDRAWDLGRDAQRTLIYQARMTWTPAFLSLREEDDARRDALSKYALHGLDFLINTLGDERNGGFRERTASNGEELSNVFPLRNLYGQSFGIYASATAYEATGDARALQTAIDAFSHVEESAHDPKHGGYFEHWTPEGRVLMVAPDDPRTVSAVGRIGRKSMNSHIHLLEALTALDRVADDPLVRERLYETFRLVRDVIVAPSGALVMFADPSWTPEETLSSFGHELETAYLLDETAELMQLAGEELELTHSAMRRLIRHSLEWGCDDQYGGFYNEGPVASRPSNREKVWWVQAEAWNGLLTGIRRFEDLRPACLPAFLATWRFFEASMLDPAYGGCYSEVEESGELIPGRTAKANEWKTAYHVARGLAHAVDSL